MYISLRITPFIHQFIHILPNKVGCALGNEPSAIPPYVFVVVIGSVSYLHILASQSAFQVHLAVGNSRSMIAVDFNRLLPVDVIHMSKIGEIARKGFADVLTSFISTYEFAIMVGIHFCILGEKQHLSVYVLLVGKNREGIHKLFKCHLIFQELETFRCALCLHTHCCNEHEYS